MDEQKIKTELLEWVKSFLFAVPLALFITTFIVQPTTVHGESMEPTLQDGNRLIVEKITYRFGKPERGDIVTLKSPIDSSKNYVKRVIGVEGDRVKILNGKVYINGKELKEKYVSGRTVGDMEEITVPKGYIYVMGDNRAPGASLDSRNPSIGPISLDRVIGRAVLRFYPVDKAVIFK